MGEVVGFNPELLPDLLPLYYKRLFPCNLMYRWLSYSSVKPNYFQNREFSFTLADDIYLRYQSFLSQEELEREIQKRCPHKIDIGAVFSSRPRDHRTSSAFQPLEKELVFDIDMTDYDDVRTCCSGAEVCTKCWRFMVLSVKILDKALRDDFGFRDLLWVFSGRRGVHCWVCDDRARSLDQPARTAVAEYLQLIQGGENQHKKVNLPGDRFHPSIQRACRIIDQQFEVLCLEEQDILGDAASLTKVLALVPDAPLRQTLEKELQKYSMSRERWQAFKNCVKEMKDKGELKKRRQNLVEEIMLQYSYPRLDINVTKGLNHLLKSPFCIHPKTGKVCVPFDPKTVEKFDPMSVPTISQLIEEINQFDAKPSNESSVDGEKKRVKDYKKTSMYKATVVFEEFVTKLEKAQRARNMDSNDRKLEF